MAELETKKSKLIYPGKSGVLLQVERSSEGYLTDSASQLWYSSWESVNVTRSGKRGMFGEADIEDLICLGAVSFTTQQNSSTLITPIYMSPPTEDQQQIYTVMYFLSQYFPPKPTKEQRSGGRDVRLIESMSN